MKTRLKYVRYEVKYVTVLEHSSIFSFSLEFLNNFVSQIIFFLKKKNRTKLVRNGSFMMKMLKNLRTFICDEECPSPNKILALNKNILEILHACINCVLFCRRVRDNRSESMLCYTFNLST